MNLIEHIEGRKHQSLVSFHNLSIHDHFIKNVMSFFDIVHDIKFADIFKILIHGFYQIVNKLQVGHLVLYYWKTYLLLQIQTDDEIQWSVATVNDFVASNIKNYGTDIRWMNRVISCGRYIYEPVRLQGLYVILLSFSCNIWPDGFGPACLPSTGILSLFISLDLL